MTLQTSGAISLSQVQAEYGGSNPISMSEYYKYGDYVPAYVSVTTWQPSASTDYFSTSAPSYYWYKNGGGSYWYTAYAYWNGTQITGMSTTATSYTTGGWTYYRTSVRSSSTYVYEYAGIRRSGTTSESVNPNVPIIPVGDLPISMDDFYGGRKT